MAVPTRMESSFLKVKSWKILRMTRENGAVGGVAVGFMIIENLVFLVGIYVVSSLWAGCLWGCCFLIVGALWADM